MNGVCTNIIHMHKKKLNYYSGNYDQYVQTRAELEENQMKRYKWEQEQISHMKVGARAGLGGTFACVQSRSRCKSCLLVAADCASAVVLVVNSVCEASWCLHNTCV